MTTKNPVYRSVYVQEHPVTVSVKSSGASIWKKGRLQILSKSNELNEDVERGIYNKRSADDHTTLPPVINRLDSGSVLRMTYVNQPTEELRRQFLKDILRFSKCRDNVSKSSTIIFK